MGLWLWYNVFMCMWLFYQIRVVTGGGDFLVNKVKRGSMPPCCECVCVLPSASMVPWDSWAHRKGYPTLSQIKCPTLSSKENKQTRLPATSDNHQTSNTQGRKNTVMFSAIRSVWNKWNKFYLPAFLLSSSSCASCVSLFTKLISGRFSYSYTLHLLQLN